MNTYICFYRQKEVEVQAETSYQAQLCAAGKFGLKEKNAYRVLVMLHKKADGTIVEHIPDF